MYTGIQMYVCKGNTALAAIKCRNNRVVGSAVYQSELFGFFSVCKHLHTYTIQVNNY